MFESDERRISHIHQALDSLAQAEVNFTSIDVFSDQEIDALIAQTSSCEFRTATAIVGKGVHQDMDVCFPAPRIGLFDDCASLLEEAVNSWDKSADYIGTTLHLNDFAIQKYPANSQGIGVHKDGLRYKFLIFIITLSGTSRLFHTAERDGAPRHAIDDRHGRLVILKAPDFGGFASEDRLYHGVDQIKSGRLSIGFRHEQMRPTS